MRPRLRTLAAVALATAVVSALPADAEKARKLRKQSSKKETKADAPHRNITVYHASNSKFAPSALRTNAKGLLHVSTRASFSMQYGANLHTFTLKDKRLFRLELHEGLLRKVLGEQTLSTSNGALGINTHHNLALHGTLKKLGFDGYHYKQYDWNRDRYVDNFALFDAKLLKPTQSSP